ncbi:hypothetical protein KKHLCK_16130 [Candidatus Electrothrix laxa]
MLSTAKSAWCTVPVFNNGRKISRELQYILWEHASQHPECTSSAILQNIKAEYGNFNITTRHVNRLRQEWGVSRKKGRPCGRRLLNAPGGEFVKLTPNLPFVGVCILDAFVEQNGIIEQVATAIQIKIACYKKENPEETFPLLYHKKQTIITRFKALFYAAFFGIGKLTEYDVKEHGLEALIGRGYQNNTLRQFLGELERIDAADILISLLTSSNQGQLGYIDGHMIPFWTGAKMHKGKITMLGRIMPGSNAIVAHNEQGQAIFMDYYPPDIRMPAMILEYCEKIVNATGIRSFVIDREINSVKIAREFKNRDWGLLSMLDSNEYKALSDWDTECICEYESGDRLYTGRWATPREDDPRIFVILEADERLLVYWGTPKLQESLPPVEWPEVYSRRTEIQENSFKRMINNGALNVNFGIKKIVGPDRHKERKVKVLKDRAVKVGQKIENKKNELAKQKEKVAESKQKKHKKRLEQRKNKRHDIENDLRQIEEKERKIKEGIESLGPVKERSDRDFRKQKIMTFRTLLMENLLMAFIRLFNDKLDQKIGTDTLMSIFFRRSGSCMETASEITYELNTIGLSSHYKKVLGDITSELTAMGIQRHGKLISVRLREAPT